jgi:molybdopterin biosynthesis enzyme
VPVRLAHDVRAGDRIEYMRAVVRVDPDGTLGAAATGPQSSSRLLSAAGANALVIVPARGGTVPEGTRLDALLIGPLVGQSD